MARIAKALVPPEQGYTHREHRSKKGRVQDYMRKKKIRRKLRILKQEIPEEPEVKQFVKRKGIRRERLTS